MFVVQNRLIHLDKSSRGVGCLDASHKVDNCLASS
jgi:hypothetical protein